MSAERLPVESSTAESYEPGLVSIILPTYNRADRIGRAIESAVDQTYTHWELIVVLDGASAESVAVVKAVMEPRLRILYLQPNRGVEGARNAGLDIARGEFIAFLDDDDVWFPTKLADQVALLRTDPRLGLVHGPVIDLYPEGRRVKRFPPPDANSYAGNLVRDCLATSSVIVRRSVLDKVGLFDPEVYASGDWEMWTRVIKAYPIASTPEPVALTEQWAGSITHGSASRLARNRALVIRRHWQEIRALGLGRKTLAHHDAFVGVLCLNAGLKQQARRRVRRSVKLRPSLRAGLLYLASFLPTQRWYQVQRLRRRLRR